MDIDIYQDFRIKSEYPLETNKQVNCKQTKQNLMENLLETENIYNFWLQLQINYNFIDF